MTAEPAKYSVDAVRAAAAKLTAEEKFARLAAVDSALIDTEDLTLGADPVTSGLECVPGPATRTAPPTRRIDTARSAQESQRRPRVFLSYAHEDSAHTDAVLAFATFLVRESGIDVRLDRWEQEVCRDWNVWAIENIQEADFVLVITSPTYKAVGEGHENNDYNRGLHAEMALIREAVFRRQQPSGVLKYLPVVLPGGKLDDLPKFMQTSTVHSFHVTSFTHAGAENLLRTLTQQSAHVPAEPPGYLPPLPLRSLRGMTAKLKFRRKRALPLPPDPLDRLKTLGRFMFDIHSAGIDSTVAWADCIRPFHQAAIADPEGFLVALRELVADDTIGLATYGAYCLAGELLGFDNPSPDALALQDAAIAYKRAHGLPSTRLTGYEMARWHETHGPGSW